MPIRVKGWQKRISISYNFSMVAEMYFILKNKSLVNVSSIMRQKEIDKLTNLDRIDGFRPLFFSRSPIVNIDSPPNYCTMVRFDKNSLRLKQYTKLAKESSFVFQNS